MTVYEIKGRFACVGASGGWVAHAVAFVQVAQPLDIHPYLLLFTSGRGSGFKSVIKVMNAKTVVRKLIEQDESPKDFLERNKHILSNSGTRWTRYHFNIGEGNYRCGIAFDIIARSRSEAVELANRFLQNFFFRAPGHGGALELASDTADVTAASSLRVYVDDEVLAIEADIVAEYEVE